MSTWLNPEFYYIIESYTLIMSISKIPIKIILVYKGVGYQNPKKNVTCKKHLFEKFECLDPGFKKICF